MKNSLYWKSLGISFSLANLWFISFWKKFIYAGDYHYYAFEAHTRNEYLAVLIDVIFQTGIFWVLIKISFSASKDWLKRAAQITFLVIGFSTFGALSAEIIRWLSPDTINFINLPLPLIVLCLCLIFSIKHKFSLEKIVYNLKLIGLFLLPFSFLIFLQFFWVKFVDDPKNLLPKNVEMEVSATNSPQIRKKVVWIIFDNTDYAALTAAMENKYISVPDIKRLMNESFVAQNAFSPNDATTKSIPALFTGKPLRAAIPVAANDLLIYPKDNSQPFSWRESDNIISEVNEMSGKIALVGWCHPYPRIFKEKISYGFWHSAVSPRCTGAAGVAGCSVNNLIDSLYSVPFATRLFPSLWTTDLILPNDDHDQQIARNNFLTGKAEELISNPKLDFLFFHFSVPHPPYIGRRNLKGRESYFDSLEAMNDIVKRLREKLEAAGQWNDTYLIVSSDHWWRNKKTEDFNFLPEDQIQKVVTDIRIPFIVKLLGQTTKIEYRAPLNTIITKELILAIFKNKIKSSEDFIGWLENMRADQPELINLQTVREAPSEADALL